MKSYLILFSLLILVVSSFAIQKTFADKSGIYKFQCSDGDSEITYHIAKGIITNMESTSNRDLKISIKEATNGNITVNIPRSFVDAKIAGMDDAFFVLVNKNEIYWKDQIEVRNPTTRILTIPFPEGDVTIDIIAGGIPERPRTRNCSTEEIGWENYWMGGNFYDVNSQLVFQVFKIPYKISGGEIKSVQYHDIFSQLLFDISAKNEGMVIVKVPKNLPLSESGLEPRPIILVNGEEIKYDLEKTRCFQIYSIQIKSETQQIEVIEAILGKGHVRSFKVSDDCVIKPSPKQQIAHGNLPENIFCRDGLELIFKSTDGTPACVKPQTVQKLMERGWAR